jgi:hypothetical protein
LPHSRVAERKVNGTPQTRERPENHKEVLKMLEAIKSQRLTVRVLFVLAAMVVAVMAASAMSNASGSLGSSLGAKEADAAVAYRQIKGTVFRSDTQKAVPYAYADLYYWKPNCVQSTCWTYWKRVQANAYGQYSFSNNPTGYSYYVKGWAFVGGSWFQGNSNSFYLSPNYSGALTANVTVRMPNPY